MHIPNEILYAPNPNADLALIGILDDYARGLLKQMPRQSTLSEGVRLQLLKDLRGGVPTAATVARALHMSVRTLHRSLQREGTTFHEILSQLRQEQAAQHLAGSTLSIAEVGFLLGFSELSSFYRAFKGWTGKTPAEFRAEAQLHTSSH
jgi:AraC-like DNA-binding protein